jgi:hypothetical protein
MYINDHEDEVPADSSRLSSFLVDGGVRKPTIHFSRITFNAACSAARTTSSL